MLGGGGGDPGNVHNNNIHTAPDNFEFTESSTLDRTFLYITKTDGKETWIDEKRFNIKKKKLKFVSWTSLKI